MLTFSALYVVLLVVKTQLSGMPQLATYLDKFIIFFNYALRRILVSSSIRSKKDTCIFFNLQQTFLQHLLKDPKYFHWKRASSEINQHSFNEDNTSEEMTFIEHLLHARQL